MRALNLYAEQSKKIDAERCDIEREMGRKMDCVDDEVGAELIAKFSCLAQVGHRAKCVLTPCQWRLCACAR